MGIRTENTVRVTATGTFDIEDLIKELRATYPAGRTDEYNMQTTISVYKATDQRDSDAVTFNLTPIKKTDAHLTPNQRIGRP